MTEKKSKICSKCKQEKSLCDFHKSATKKFGVQSQCKKCRNELDAKYRRENLEKVKESKAKYRRENLEKVKESNAKYRRENSEKLNEYHAKYRRENSEKLNEYQAKYRRENREKEKERGAKYRRENPEKVKESDAKYRRENLEKVNEYQAKYRRERYKNDENFRVVQLLRNRFWKSLKSQSAKKSKRTLELVGCSRDELWEHLENQFKDGMTRQNQGEWHIDHIKPCSLFDLTDPEQQKECFNYKNLQPLWAEENLRKGAKW
jgi:hypothetical protein